MLNFAQEQTIFQNLLGENSFNFAVNLDRVTFNVADDTDETFELCATILLNALGDLPFSLDRWYCIQDEVGFSLTFILDAR